MKVVIIEPPELLPASGEAMALNIENMGVSSLYTLKSDAEKRCSR
jgi:hypothetical protein